MTFSTAHIISFDLNTAVNESGRAEINILVIAFGKTEIKKGSHLHKLKVLDAIF